MWTIFKHNIWQLLICLDQFLYCLICLFTGTKSWADCTLSAAAYMWSVEKIRQWPKKLIDGLFYFIDQHHCYNSYVAELKRQHFAPNMRGD